MDQYQGIFGTINRTLERQVIKDTKSKLYKDYNFHTYMEVTLSLLKQTYNKIQTAKIKYLRSIKGVSD